MSFYILEETVIGMCHGKTAIESIPQHRWRKLEGPLPSALSFVVLMLFFALKELARTIGDDNLYELFFVRKEQGRCRRRPSHHLVRRSRRRVLGSHLCLSCPTGIVGASEAFGILR